jgi:heme exporter protein C
MFTRNRAIVLLVTAYFMVLYGIYNVLMVFGPIKTDVVPMQETYRNVFFHVPISAVMYLAFTLTLIGSIMYLKSRDLKWDTFAFSSAKLGLVFGILTLITGMAWAKDAWNVYWNGDPRMTTALILWFLFAAYFSLRSAIDNREAKARLSAILGIFAYVGVPLTYISTTVWFSLHPKLKDWVLGEDMRIALLMLNIGVIIVFAHILWLEIRYQNLKSGTNF